MLISLLFFYEELVAEILWFVTTKLGSITDTIMINLRSNLEFKDEEFSDIDNFKEALSAVLTALHRFSKNRKTSVIDNLVIWLIDLIYKNKKCEKKQKKRKSEVDLKNKNINKKEIEFWIFSVEHDFWIIKFSKLINLALLQILAVSVTWQFFSKTSRIECIICLTIDLVRT